MKQIIFGTLIGLILFLLKYQLKYTTISINKDYVRITPLTIDATPLNYNALFTDRTGNTSLNSTFIKTQENLNRTRNLTQQDLQISSLFVNDKIVEKCQQQRDKAFSPFISHLQLQETETQQHFRKQLYNPR